MKISKYLLIGLAALTLASCEKDDPTFANYIPPKGGTEDPGKTEEGPEIPAGAVKAEVTIDRNTTYQTIAGFGASDCWAPAFVGKNWTKSPPCSSTSRPPEPPPAVSAYQCGA